MPLHASEQENHDGVFNFLKEAIGPSLEQGIAIGKEVLVPYRQVYYPGTPLNRLEIHSFSQDICIFRNLLLGGGGYQNVRVVNAANGSVLDIATEKNAPLGLPYVIVEAKLGGGDQPTTDNLLAYVQKAQLIKTVFPYVEYLLLVFGTVPPRVYKHGAAFDAVLSIEDLSKTSLESVRIEVATAYDRAVKKIGRLGGR